MKAFLTCLCLLCAGLVSVGTCNADCYIITNQNCGTINFVPTDSCSAHGCVDYPTGYGDETVPICFKQQTWKNNLFGSQNRHRGPAASGGTLQSGKTSYTTDYAGTAVYCVQSQGCSNYLSVCIGSSCEGSGWSDYPPAYYPEILSGSTCFDYF